MILLICVSACAPPDTRPTLVELLPRDAGEELHVSVAPAIDPAALTTTRLGEVGGREVFSSTRRAGDSTRTVLLERAAPAAAMQPLLEVAFQEGVFGDGSAELHTTAAHTFLVVRVDVPGTGSFNQDVVLHWREQHWVQIDAAKWLTDFELPPCYEIWKGRRPDLAALRGASPLWVAGDPNCCPSGGEVSAELEVRDRAIRVRRQASKLTPLDMLREDPQRAQALKTCAAGRKP